jgi:hypothetical protein
MITLITETFDSQSGLSLQESADSQIGNRVRRINKRRLLDGTVFVDPRGYSAADTDFALTIQNITEADAEQVAYLMETYSSLIITTRRGVFRGSLQNYAPSGADLKFAFIVSEEIT